MKRYTIIFCGLDGKKWKLQSSEEYDDLIEVKDRFFKAVELSKNSVESVLITVTDEYKKMRNQFGEVIMEFTYLVD